MSFGDRLKEKREEMGITQVQLAELLGVSKGAIGNYEAGINSPKATMLYKIFDALKCDANFLFQDEIIGKEKETEFSKHEISMIEKYRTLDSYGSDLVDTVLEKEYERCNDTKENGTLQFTVKQETGKIAARNGRELSSDEKNRLLQILNSGT